MVPPNKTNIEEELSIRKIHSEKALSLFTLWQKKDFTLIKSCRAHSFFFLPAARCFLAASSCLLDLMTSQLWWRQQANEPSVRDRQRASNTLTSPFVSSGQPHQVLKVDYQATFAFQISCKLKFEKSQNSALTGNYSYSSWAILNLPYSKCIYRINQSQDKIITWLIINDVINIYSSNINMIFSFPIVNMCWLFEFSLH